jgi:hypothetical protein
LTNFEVFQNAVAVEHRILNPTHYLEYWKAERNEREKRMNKKTEERKKGFLYVLFNFPNTGTDIQNKTLMKETHF